MPYRPRELVVRAREAATMLLQTLDHEEIVARFLDLYAAEYRRPGRADQPVFYREQLERIRRECVLAAVLRLETALPTRLKVTVTVRQAKRQRKKGETSQGHKRAKGTPKKKAPLELAIPFLDLFREEFFFALGQAMEWTEEDAREFWRDLDLYRMLSTRNSSRGPAHGTGAASGPFVDRVALLLDPSLMEQARRSAGKFQVEINATADRVLRK